MIIFVNCKIQGEGEAAQNNSKSKVTLLPQYLQYMKMVVVKIESLADSKLYCCKAKVKIVSVADICLTFQQTFVILALS